jgi:hypothetical protein
MTISAPLNGSAGMTTSISSILGREETRTAEELAPKAGAQRSQLNPAGQQKPIYKMT